MLQDFANELRIRGYTPRTIRSYLTHTEKFLSWAGKDSSSVTTSDIRAYIVELMDRSLKATTINLSLSAIKFYFSEYLNLKITQDIKKVKTEKNLVDPPKKDEIRRMMDVLDNPKKKLLIMFLASTGCRVEEAICRKWTDIDAQTLTLTVRLGKGQKDRKTVVSREFTDTMLAFKPDIQDEDYLFPSNKGGHITARRAQQILKDAKEKASVKRKASPHKLRAYFCTSLLENGVDIRTTQALMGHENMNTTASYTKVSQHLIEAVKAPF